MNPNLFHERVTTHTTAALPADGSVQARQVFYGCSDKSFVAFSTRAGDVLARWQVALTESRRIRADGVTEEPPTYRFYVADDQPGSDGMLINTVTADAPHGEQIIPGVIAGQELHIARDGSMQAMIGGLVVYNQLPPVEQL